MTTIPRSRDRAGGVTGTSRLLLGAGVIAGPIYLVVGVLLALTRDGFDITRYPLSLLMLGEHGWMQRINLILSGVLSMAGAAGLAYAMGRLRRTTWTATLVAVFGLCLVASGIFPPDPMAGFPPGTEAVMTSSGALHLLFGMIGFLLLSVATFVFGSWCSRRGGRRRGIWSRITGLVVILGFVSGAFMPIQELGTLTLWIAVVAAWSWLTVTSIHLLRIGSDG